MNNTNTGGAAFPTEKTIGANKDGTWITEIPGQSGMTLRDYFAAKALQGFAARDAFDPGLATPEQRAKLAYIDADAMLKAREA